MYAIIECGGKQYKVQEGDVLKAEKVDTEVGSTFIIDKVLMLGGDKTVIGTPLVEGVKVTCKVMNQDKDKKILVFHYKAKKNIRKRYGHRQPFTSILIEKIEKVKKTTKKAAAESAETAEQVEA
jgi:large subunit ribosomal protein L21